MNTVKKDKKITVIVTVHNAEKYLKECLDSVLSQTFSDIEVLCMDGGSIDSSPQILKEYAMRDARIRIINDTNTSYGHKVNEGIRQARGKYISVLESDDMYQPDMLRQLYEIAEKYHVDYANADYLNFFDIGGKRFKTLVKMYPESDYGKRLESGKHPEDMRQILRYWTGIFRREFLTQKEIWMNESPGASFQDMSFRFLTSALADTSYHLNIPVYLYRVDNPESSVYDPGKAVVIADEFDFLKAELLRRNIKNKYIWKHFYVWKYNDFYGNLIRFGETARKALFDRCYDELEKDRENLQILEGASNSNAILTLLNKSKEEVWEQIEQAFSGKRNQDRKLWEFLNRLGDNEIVIFGCGIRGKAVLDYLQSADMEKQLCCFTDNSEKLWNTERKGHMILPPAEAAKLYPSALFIIANKDHGDEIFRQLSGYGVENTIRF